MKRNLRSTRINLNEILVAAIFLHFHGIMDEIKVLAIGPAKLQAVVISLNTLEPRRIGRQRTSAEFESCRIWTDTDGVGGLNANSEKRNTHTQKERMKIKFESSKRRQEKDKRERERERLWGVHLLIRGTNL